MAIFSIGTSPAEVRITPNTMYTPAEVIHIAAEIIRITPNTMSTPVAGIHMAAEIIRMTSNTMSTPADGIRMAAGGVGILAREVWTSNQEQRMWAGGGVEVGAGGAAPHVGPPHGSGGGTHSRGGGADTENDASPASRFLPWRLGLYEEGGYCHRLHPNTPTGRQAR